MPLTPTAYWTERQVAAMGSTAVVTIGGADDALAGWALAELVRLEQAWSRFEPASELSALNGRPGGWVPVSLRLFAAVSRALELWQATGGAFDASVLEALEHAGYDKDFADLERNDPRPAKRPRRPPGCSAVELDEAARAVRLPPGCRLDLGGIGKGLAADLIAQGLIDRGARSALVALGGDIRVSGQAPDGGWRIPVEDPFRPGLTLLELPLSRGAAVTSTTLIRTWRRAGRAYHHIIDPRTGTPVAGDVAAVVAIAPTASWAEGMAKAAVVLGRTSGVELLRAAGVAGWVFATDGSWMPITGEGTPPWSPN